MTTLLKQKINVTVFSWFCKKHVDFNKKPIREGISKVNDYIQILKADSGKKFNIFNAEIEIECNILRVSNAMNAVQRNLDLLKTAL
jgi:hypothetical protein